MNDLIINYDLNYNIETAEGRKNLQEVANSYNARGEATKDILHKNINIEDAIAFVDIEMYIKRKNLVTIIQEAIEKAYNLVEFKRSSVINGVIKGLQKKGIPFAVRLEVENYIKARCLYGAKSIDKNAVEFVNVQKMNICGDVVYVNVATGEELEGEKLQQFLQLERGAN